MSSPVTTTEVAKGRGWRIVRVESEHAVFYVQEALICHWTGKEFVGKWLTQGVHVFVTAGAATAVARAMGQAQVDAIVKAREAAEAKECPVCLGQKTAMDDPSKPCGACSGTGRKP